MYVKKPYAAKKDVLGCGSKKELKIELLLLLLSNPKQLADTILTFDRNKLGQQQWGKEFDTDQIRARARAQTHKLNRSGHDRKEGAVNVTIKEGKDYSLLTS